VERRDGTNRPRESAEQREGAERSGNVERGGGRPDVAGRNEGRDEAGRGSRDPGERNSDNRADRGGRDLTVNDGGRNNRDRAEGRERNARERAKVDRRPARDGNVEERQRRTARSEVRQKVTKERKRELAQREERNRDRVRQFRAERQNRASAVQERRRAIRATRTENRRENLADSRREIREYWRDRADDVRDRIADRRDRLFDDNWWEERRWRDRPILVSNPWWWWQPARWSTVNVFIEAGWNEPILYDYGTDVIYDDAAVYVHGESWGTPVEYSRRVVELANPPVEVVAEAPVVQEEWTPMGVWALVQENQGDAVMFFQLSVNKQGLMRGAYANVVSGEELPIVGQVDKKTQRAAWHIGDETQKVFEAGMANLGENEASCMVHVGEGEMQNWLLVRMESPNLPDRPAQLSDVSEPEVNAAASR
jgi:hypothetical protein